MADRFYVNCALEPGAVLLEGAEAHHLAAVCRLRVGDQVCLFNGDGHEYPAVIEVISKRSVELVVQERRSPEREGQRRVIVAAPVPKGDRGQFLVEKLTELGVTAFVPLRSERSVVHAGAGKRDKLERYVIEASKQCGRNRLMSIEPQADWASWCGGAELPAARYLGDPGGEKLPAAVAGDVALAVGPEGGFSPAEIECARAAQWQAVSLGPRILRIETAALALATWAAHVW
ncbi:MAG: 16S rRNA (uracil(1498)-N(3))-methyltransferase [Gemmataceae bacterium]